MCSLSSQRHPDIEPSYHPTQFDLLSNYNVLKLSEIHAFEETDHIRRQNYRKEISDQINSFVSEYGVEEVWILGDTGSFDDVYEILDGLEDESTVKLVAGDEDKDSKKVNGNNYTGWFRQVNSSQPFDVSVPYKIYDECFESQINGFDIQASHHPHATDRDDQFNGPDERESEILDSIFSVKRDTNQNTVKRTPSSLRDVDMAVYDHVHMPYVRNIEDKLLEGLGGRRFNYQIDNDCLPKRSIHLSSFDEDKIHTLHFDAEYDSIFEHLVFDPVDEKLYDVEETRDSNRQSGYYPIQSRFRNDQIRRDSWESEDQIPDFWQ